MKNYEEIIDLPHFHAPEHGFMPNLERAAQFMPFKSLKGYEEMIGGKAEETANKTDMQIEYSDEWSDLAAEDYFE